MINSLSLKNFKSWKDTLLEFHKGVNAIVGTTDAGKSNVIRAIRWVVFNRPSAESRIYRNRSGFKSAWHENQPVNITKSEFRGQGLATTLLNRSVETVKKMGGVAAVTHIWMESPGGGAMKYFAKAGGEFVRLHKNRWLEDCIKSNYRCL